MKLSKEDFNCGTPFSCWLKEQLTGEVGAYLHNYEHRGLVEKYKASVDENTKEIIMNIKKLDDLPDDLRKIAVDIIRADLDKAFEASS